MLLISSYGNLPPAICGHFPLPPVRIDMAGGWTDTPPQAYEWGGAVSPPGSHCQQWGKGKLYTCVVMDTASPDLATSHDLKSWDVAMVIYCIMLTETRPFVSTRLLAKWLKCNSHWQYPIQYSLH